MRALAGSGRRTDALRAFQAYRAFLATRSAPSRPTRSSPSTARSRREPTTDIPPAHSRGVFLMTDIVGSTRLWAEQPDAMGSDLAVHDDLLSHAIAEHRRRDHLDGGRLVRRRRSTASTTQSPRRSPRSSALAATAWALDDGIRVRMGVHLGAARSGGAKAGTGLRSTRPRDDGGGCPRRPDRRVRRPSPRRCPRSSSSISASTGCATSTARAASSRCQVPGLADEFPRCARWGRTRRPSPRRELP